LEHVRALAPGAYDYAGQLRTATKIIDQVPTMVTTEYDEAGRVKKMIDSFGPQANLTYDQGCSSTGLTQARRLKPATSAAGRRS
jgi:hypothetical protein